MSFYFRDKPKLGEKLRGRSSDELLQEIKQQFDEDSKSFFEPTGGGRSSTRDPFERHTVFPRGFPFDDEGFGRRSDIRTHLDQLAARHPEFADHLLGPAWGDIPFHGSLRARNRRGSGNGSNNNYQGYSDEDARSQASGSSAASGASAVSSHGESEGSRNNHRERSRDEPDTDCQQTAGKTQIPQYGFRNTVDIGQHRHNMENPDKGNRGQRSMSAPPENRQQFCQQQPHQCHHNCQQQQFQPQPQSQSQQQPRPQQGQRYVSRIDITPQHNQPQSQFQQPQQQQQPQSQQPQQQQQQQKPASQQQSNVRHIPIFVEGRDEPVLPRSSDEQYFRREPSPTQFHAPPHFQRSSAFGQSPFARSHQWSPPFQDPFYPTQTGYEQPSRRQQQQTHGFQHPRQQPQPQPQPQSQSPPQQYEKQAHPQQHEKQAHPQQHREQYAQHQHHPQQQPSQQHEQQEVPPPRPKPVVPKDPLERVAMVQKEVDSLAEQVKRYSGSSRKDKEYVYLDEMLTRELIKLDDIETEGRENVRQARKNAIKTIQETIGLLESKAPLASQPATPQQTEKPIVPTDFDQFESMDVDPKEGEQQQTNEAIPLPPGPSSPLNNPEKTVHEEKKEEVEEEEETKKKNSTATDAEQPSNDSASVEPMDTTGPALEKPEEKQPAEEPTPMDVQESSEGSNVEVKKTLPESKEAKIETNVSEENAQADQKKMENDSSSATSDVVPTEKPSSQETAAAVESDITAPASRDNDKETQEVDRTVKQSPKTPKKGKKTKKQSTASSSTSTAPVSDTPIPLPPPESTETNEK